MMVVVPLCIWREATYNHFGRSLPLHNRCHLFFEAFGLFWAKKMRIPSTLACPTLTRPSSSFFLPISFFFQLDSIPSSSPDALLLRRQQQHKHLFQIKQKEKEVRVLILGLDNAGKTTATRRLLGEPTDAVMPTVGFNIDTIVHDSTGHVVNLWDVGGQRSIRAYWRNYFERTDGLVWVVDASDAARLDLCRSELESLLTEERLAGASLLILANKQDVPSALSSEEIADALGLAVAPPNRVAESGKSRHHQQHQQGRPLNIGKNRHWNVVGCSAVTGDGLSEGFDWIITDIAGRIFMLD